MVDTDIKRRGLMLVLSSPSGAGKTTISRRLLETDDNLSLSVSATTRPPRPGEADGVDYFFVAPERFAGMVENGELLEHDTVAEITKADEIFRMSFARELTPAELGEPGPGERRRHPPR